MDNSALVALSRMMAQQQLLDVRAANIANMSTPGFKAGGVLFSDYLVKQPGATVPGGQTEQMVQDRVTYRDFSQGEIAKTGSPLDFALTGPGFFVVSTPQGDRYTRAGRFSLSASGQIVDIQGNVIQGSDGRPLNVPSGDTRIKVTADGTVTTESGQIGKLHIVKFDDPQTLQPEGATMFSSNETPQQMTQPAVVQGAIESANVSSVVEVTRMMAEMREFDFASQFVDGESQLQQSAIDHILKSS